MTQLKLEIPDDLAHRLKGIASAQHKSVEQVAVEGLRSLIHPPGSPAAILQVAASPPHLTGAALAELDEAIASGRIPVRDQGSFDE